ncbi:MAG: hypothetical protein ACRESK_07745, partial [Gammaproteobacteria bacterium]
RMSACPAQGAIYASETSLQFSENIIVFNEPAALFHGRRLSEAIPGFCPAGALRATNEPAGWS